jgi:putative CocE/NonD family hydrolase
MKVIVASRLIAAAAASFVLAGSALAADDAVVPDAAKIDMHWGVKIPLRDGVQLSAIVYTAKDHAAPSACIFTLTPYIAQSYHDRGVYFAAHGLPFLTVDVRGRGNSGGEFHPLIQEAKDGYDVVEWLAKQPYCNGKVAMWGGSYAGYDQWATAKERPAHLATILPMAAPYPGADFPYRNNITSPYLMQWLLFTSGHASQVNIFGDHDFWASLWKQRFVRGEPFNNLEHIFGGGQPTLHEWVAHPQVDAYYDAYVATPEQMRALDIPILTITGVYDTQQAGALAWYKSYMQAASPEQRERHFLIIGPWDHAGTRTPKSEVGGVKFGPASLVDRPKLDIDWYGWTMAAGPKPDFLKKLVAYYVMGEERWRYADSLEAVTARTASYFLDSATNASHVLASGSLDPAGPGRGPPDHYVYDPRDVSIAELETENVPNYLTDQRLILASDDKHLIYETRAFDKPTEISGFFKLTSFIAIDQPDTDLEASVYEIDRNGQSILLTDDQVRARYRESQRTAKLVTTRHAQRYDFDHFTFVSRRIADGSRLRLVIGPINSIYSEKNYNSGKLVSEETMADARAVTVTLLHDKVHPSALYVPMGQPD